MHPPDQAGGEGQCMNDPELMKEIEALNQMSVPDLLDRYERVYGKPPRVKRREHMLRRLAWKVQEQRLGGLSGTAKKRLKELRTSLRIGECSNMQLSVSARSLKRRPDDPTPGTILVRRYRATDVRVTTLEDGRYSWEGNIFASLSAVARAVTGAHWNGRLFFGLTSRKKAK